LFEHNQIYTAFGIICGVTNVGFQEDTFPRSGELDKKVHSGK